MLTAIGTNYEELHRISIRNCNLQIDPKKGEGLSKKLPYHCHYFQPLLAQHKTKFPNKKKKKKKKEKAQYNINIPCNSYIYKIKTILLEKNKEVVCVKL